MAAKSRSQRKTRAQKAAAKAHIQLPAARSASARAAAAVPGMVETALAAFAHEVRTPLTGILAISDLLVTSDLDERERRWARPSRRAPNISPS